MPQFSVNAQRFDPYKNFKFRVFWEGSTTPVAGVSKVGGLKRTTEVVEHRAWVSERHGSTRTRSPPTPASRAAIGSGRRSIGGGSPRSPHPVPNRCRRCAADDRPAKDSRAGDRSTAARRAERARPGDPQRGWQGHGHRPAQDLLAARGLRTKRATWKAPRQSWTRSPVCRGGFPSSAESLRWRTSLLRGTAR